MTSLSCRERLQRVYRCQPVDRMPVRIWGVDPMSRNSDPTWEPLYAMVEELGLDIIRDWSPPVPESAGDPPPPPERRDSEKPGMWEIENTVQTPEGPLTQVSYAPKNGAPGYVKKHYIETEQDAKRWLSTGDADYRPPTDTYWDFDRQTGGGAMVMIGLGEAMYSIQAMMGSETFGYWLMDERELLREMIDKAFRGVEKLAKHYLSHDIGDCYGWVGPELCIPPLASPNDCREFVLAYDKRIIDMVHDAGKLVWIHCHGDMDPVLEIFVEMGVDCLNPIEPPPMGRLTLAEAKARVAGQMCLEGGVEDGDFDLRTPSEITAIVEDVVAQGKPGGGFILCPTSAPSTWGSQQPRHIANYRAFCETGMRLAAYD